MTGGTLAIRLLVAGILLVIGLPILSMLLYIWGYPASPVPRPIVILVDGLQILIVAYAVVVGAQLTASAGSVLRRRGWRTSRRVHPVRGERSFSEQAVAASAAGFGGRASLREWSQRLADMIWTQEQRGRPEFGPAALAYVRDGVALQLEYRRHATALERRAVELEAWMAQDSVVASERM